MQTARARPLVLCLLVAGCASFGAAEPQDASPPTDAAADAQSTLPCTGTRVRAIEAVDATSPGAGSTCNAEAALDEDGVLAGLDGSGEAVALIEGRYVNGCVAVRLESGMAPGERIVVRLQALPNACDTTPCATNYGDGCGTGRSAVVFGGTVGGPLAGLDPTVEVTTHAMATDYVFTAPAGPPTEIVQICRTKWGRLREDVGVDVVYGCR